MWLCIDFPKCLPLCVFVCVCSSTAPIAADDNLHLSIHTSRFFLGGRHCAVVDNDVDRLSRRGRLLLWQAIWENAGAQGIAGWGGQREVGLWLDAGMFNSG